jgi:hypothetical protein
MALPLDCVQIPSYYRHLCGSDVNTFEGEVLPRFEKRTIILFPNGDQKWLTRRTVHPCTLSVDMASTIFLVHSHVTHFLHLAVPINIQGPPDGDELVTEEEPEHQADKSIPLSVNDERFSPLV